MNEEIQEELKACKDVVYYIKKEEQLEKRKYDAEDRLMDIIKKRYKDKLPIDGQCESITIGKYVVFVGEHRDRHFIHIVIEEE